MCSFVSIGHDRGLPNLVIGAVPSAVPPEIVVARMEENLPLSAAANAVVDKAELSGKIRA
jgi:hypothetical protein